MKKKERVYNLIIAFLLVFVIFGSIIYLKKVNSKNVEITNVQKYEDSFVNEKVTENVNTNNLCPINIYLNNAYNFDYTGGEQTFIAPIDGIYKVEVWGAQGGSYSTTYYGGYGGYSVGEISLNEGDTLYINVGGKGTDNSSYGNLYNGGYNGGGRNGANPGGKWTGGSGGGATHIATSSGLLSTFSSSVSKIIIVAGGGGGGSHALNGISAYGSGYGGSGGGYIGNTGQSTCSTTNYYGGTGGSQTTYGSSGCGTGAFGTAAGTNNDECGHGGGGGGYYGGGPGFGPGGGGGSGYIGNSLLTNKVMYCYNCSTSSAESTKTVSTTCVSSTATSNCAKQGNGYAKITLIEI